MELNCDMGERREAIADGTQESLMPFLTSVNIACGGHAGDEATMSATLEQARRWNVAVGAHPGYEDRANFGRVELALAPEAVVELVFRQVRALVATAERMGIHVRHVKPHGALYNQAVHNRGLAGAIAQGVARCTREVVLVGLAGSPMLEVFRDAGFAVSAEAFADRRYEPDGTLRSREFADSLIQEPAEAARQALEIANGRITSSDSTEIRVTAETICIHSDTPGALEIAKAVSQALRTEGFLASLSASQK